MSSNTFPSSRDSEHLTHPKYRADIDGLRAIAVLSVVGFHAFPFWVKGGFIGVDVFFVISGFLISTIMIASLERNSFSFIEFYIRRINRIFPALLVVLIFCFAFGWFTLLADEYKQHGKHIAGGAGFISNFLFWEESGYFDNVAETKPLLHLWSLGVEEQFYIVWPLLLWFAWKQRLNLLTIAIAVGISSFALNVDKVRIDAVAAFYSPQTRFWELMAGSVLAYLALHKQNRFSKFKHWLDMGLGKIIYAQAPAADGKTLSDVQSVFGAVLIAIGIFSITKERHFPGWWAALPVFGAALIISAGAQAWFNRVVLASRVLVWFGLISFPLYLWHWPLLSFARIIEGEAPSWEIRIVAAIISVVLAWLTYRLIERPIRLGNRSRSKAVTLFTMMVVVGYVGYNSYERDGLEFRVIVASNINPLENIIMQSNLPAPCISEVKVSMVNRLCTKYSSQNSKKTILIWGDSTAGAWLPVFLDIAKERQYTLINITHPSCPPLIKARKTRFDYLDSRNYCADGKTQEQIIEFIKSFKPDSIFLLASWSAYSPYSNREYITDEGDEEANSITTQRTIKNRLPETIHALEKISRLVVFRSWPILDQPPNYEVARIPSLQRKINRNLLDVKEFDNDNEFVNSIFGSIKLNNTAYFYPSKKICTDKCVYIYNGTRLYGDTYHITPQGSMQFRADIEKMIDK